MKKTYIQPSIEAIKIKMQNAVLVAMSGGGSPFGPGSGQQPVSGTPTVNSREFDYDEDYEDEEEY